MKDTKLGIIGVLIVLLIGQVIWSKYQHNSQEKKYIAELTTVVAERDSIQRHSDNMASKWASESDSLMSENNKLEKLAKELNLTIEQKNRVILTQKKIIEDLKGEVTVITDSLGNKQDKVSFGLHQDGVQVSGFTLNPPGSVHLEIDHDPIKLEVQIARTKSGNFRKGLISTSPWIKVDSWDLTITDDFPGSSESLFQRIKQNIDFEVGGFVGPGGSGIPVSVGLFGWHGGVVAGDGGISYLATKTFHPWKGK